MSKAKAIEWAAKHGCPRCGGKVKDEPSQQYLVCEGCKRPVYDYAGLDTKTVLGDHGMGGVEKMERNDIVLALAKAAAELEEQLAKAIPGFAAKDAARKAKIGVKPGASRHVGTVVDPLAEEPVHPPGGVEAAPKPSAAATAVNRHLQDPDIKARGAYNAEHAKKWPALHPVSMGANGVRESTGTQPALSGGSDSIWKPAAPVSLLGLRRSEAMELALELAGLLKEVETLSKSDDGVDIESLQDRIEAVAYRIEDIAALNKALPSRRVGTEHYNAYQTAAANWYKQNPNSLSPEEFKTHAHRGAKEYARQLGHKDLAGETQPRQIPGRAAITLNRHGNPRGTPIAAVAPHTAGPSIESHVANDMQRRAAGSKFRDVEYAHGQPAHYGEWPQKGDPHVKRPFNPTPAQRTDANASRAAATNIQDRKAARRAALAPKKPGV